MVQFEHSWRENRRGSTVVIANKTQDPEIDNAYISTYFRDIFLQEAMKMDHVHHNCVALAYLLDEYADQALEEIEEMDEDELVELATEMEDTQARRLGKVRE